MLSPPNQGSQLAKMLKRNPIFTIFTGASGKQIAELGDTQGEFAIPTFEFAIITGGDGEGGYNPALPGDDDMVVSVEETKLAGAVDFLVVPSMHTFIMNHEDVLKATVTFLKNGYLISQDRRQPIVPE